MQISGVDYGPAVPSGVSVCPAGDRGDRRITEDEIRAARAELTDTSNV
jgi:hypothetical protein